MTSPKAKEVRYDRQLRLWGDHGQQALEESRVCVVNATVTATEIMKSLVLPGVGKITIVDSTTVSLENAGCNFFLEITRVGEPRGKVAAELLGELNEEVFCDFVNESVESILANRPDFFKQFNLVIVTDLSESSLLDLGGLLWSLGIPLVVSLTYGFFAYVRVVGVEHDIIESHPENARHDLRLDCPFAELSKLNDAYDLSTLNHEKHSHTPYLILLLKALEKWRNSHGDSDVINDKNSIPPNYKEKKMFKQVILSMRMPDEKGSLEEENFAEAVSAVNCSLMPTCIPETVIEVLDHDYCVNVSKDSDAFWLKAAALKRFILKNDGHLPLRGALPDMISDSERYIELLNIYRSKAKLDAQSVFAELKIILNEHGLPDTLISLEEMQFFCKNAAFLRIFTGRSLDKEYNADKAQFDVIKRALESEESDIEMVIYLLFRAIERFRTEKDRYPGKGTNGIPNALDKTDLKERVNRVLAQINAQMPSEAPLSLTEPQSKYIDDVCRYGAAELHATAAYIGGVAAHECIKLITKQYIPIHNTFIYNAITGNGTMFSL